MQLLVRIRIYPRKVSDSKRDGISNVFVTILRKNRELLENTSLWMVDLEEDFVCVVMERSDEEYEKVPFSCISAFFKRYILHPYIHTQNPPFHANYTTPSIFAQSWHDEKVPPKRKS